MSTKKSSRHLAAIVLALALSGASFGRPIMPTLQALTRDANLIVVAQVDEVAAEPLESTGDVSAIREITRERRTATARVLEVWKGTAGERVRFRASKSWTCDVSTAVAGETVILFLTNGEDTPVMSIAYSGIGRLPIEDDAVLLYSGLLTKELKKLLDLPAQTFGHRVEVGMLKEQVRRMTEESGGAK